MIAAVLAKHDGADEVPDIAERYLTYGGWTREHGDYGLASGLGGGKKPSFATLEESVDLSHLRPEFRAASHEIHADSEGLRSNLFARGGENYALSGPTNAGAQPAGRTGPHLPLPGDDHGQRRLPRAGLRPASAACPRFAAGRGAAMIKNPARFEEGKDVSDSQATDLAESAVRLATEELEPRDRASVYAISGLPLAVLAVGARIASGLVDASAARSPPTSPPRRRF